MVDKRLSNIKVVNVVNKETKGLTQLTKEDAIKIAEEQGLDLIVLNDKGDIPVVRIADYKKVEYEKAKKAKENKKKQRQNMQDLKEIRIGVSTAKHDLQVKANKVKKMLESGDKVKLTIIYKGRIIKNIADGPSKLQEFASMVDIDKKIDKVPKIEGNRVTMVLAPLKR